MEEEEDWRVVILRVGVVGGRRISVGGENCRIVIFWLDFQIFLRVLDATEKS
jgi:hypothetical protein